ncbi:MAG TPA: sigma-70 family RNA polymerase sigma factor [Acidimicrobiales bacterium]|nr:sigma-70 family RNA polymerase sigma factor [Acidimicrobiales bacterium]
MAEDLMRQYLKEIGAYALLTAADEVRLAKAIESGREADGDLSAPTPRETGGTAELSLRGELDRATRDELRKKSVAGREAKEAFIQSNLRLVVSIAKRYQPCGLPLIDLVQEGNLGLMRAVDRFDHRRGFKFSTYATWWIRQAITRAIADKSRTIRVPVHMVETVGQVTRSTARLARRLGRDPTTAELAADTGFTAEKVRDAQRVAPDPVSLSEPVGEDDAELADFLEDPSAQASFEAAVSALEHAELRGVLATLSDREQRILELRFGLVGDRPHTLEEVGKEFELTRERIRQIEAKALSKLRHPAGPPGSEGGEAEGSVMSRFSSDSRRRSPAAPRTSR